MKVTLDVPEEVAEELRPFENQAGSIIAAGLREVKTLGSGTFNGLAQILEKLADLPSPEEVLALRPSPQLDDRIRELLRKQRDDSITPDEEAEWQRYEMIEHLMRMAKARAMHRLQAA